MNMSRESTARNIEPAEATPVKVKKIGHVVFRVRDMDKTIKFWTEVMGFTLSDRNENGMVFLRYGSDHHSIGLVQATENNEVAEKSMVSFDHCAFEVASVSELFRIREFLRSKGVEIFFEGRRGPGCNIGVEFKDPNGFHVELYAALDQIGWDGKVRPPEQWSRAKSLEEAVANPVVGAKY
jgi:catechol 2,3-dioxygenase